MNTARDPVASWLLTTVSDHLVAREQASSAVSTLGFGSAFEAWLAFEARLAVEDNRHDLCRLLGARSEDLWTATEFPNKTDFAVMQGDDLLVAVEFKLIHNNKNWQSKCDEVWNDLFPARAAKSRTARVGRLAIVGTVWKSYNEPRFYPGQRGAHPASWRSEVDEYLLPVGGWNGLQVRVAAGPVRFVFRNAPRWMVPGVEHGLELRVLSGCRRTPVRSEP